MKKIRQKFMMAGQFMDASERAYDVCVWLVSQQQQCTFALYESTCACDMFSSTHISCKWIWMGWKVNGKLFIFQYIKWWSIFPNSVLNIRRVYACLHFDGITRVCNITAYHHHHHRSYSIDLSDFHTRI